MGILTVALNLLVHKQQISHTMFSFFFNGLQQTGGNITTSLPPDGRGPAVASHLSACLAATKGEGSTLSICRAPNSVVHMLDTALLLLSGSQRQQWKTKAALSFRVARLCFGQALSSVLNTDSISIIATNKSPARHEVFLPALTNRRQCCSANACWCPNFISYRH